MQWLKLITSTFRPGMLRVNCGLSIISCWMHASICSWGNWTRAKIYYVGLRCSEHAYSQGLCVSIALWLVGSWNQPLTMGMLILCCDWFTEDFRLFGPRLHAHNAFKMSMDCNSCHPQNANYTFKMSPTLGLDLASKRKRQRADYVYRLDYRSRW